MKKTFPVNINGSIFYIDEDAYTLLNTYLDQLRKAFPGEEGKEISSDIEARIAEHFNERINAGARVIVLDDVNNVIRIMGQPSELADNNGDSNDNENNEDNEPTQAQASTPQADTNNGPTPPPYPGTPQQPQQPVVKKLYRDERHKVFGGVFAGLSIYLGWNTNLMRVIYTILTLCTYFWPCVFIYLIAWMIIPPARTTRQILEMTGSPVTLGSVSQTILGSADPNAVPAGGSSAVTTIFSILGKIIMAFLGMVAGCIGLGFLVVFFVSLCGLITYYGWGDLSLLDQLDITPIIAERPMFAGVGTILMSLAVIMPCVALVWGACCALFNARGASRTMIILGIILEIAFIVGAIILLNIAQLQVHGAYCMATASSLAAMCPLQTC